MNECDIPPRMAVSYGNPGKITIHHGSREFELDMGLETQVVAIVEDYNYMVDNLAGGESTDIRKRIQCVLDDVNDDSVSSMQDALYEIENILD